MIRRRDRVVGTLAIWGGALIAMGMMLDRLNVINIQMQNSWYYTGNVLTGASSDEAMRILEDFQRINNDYFMQTQAFARAELLTYFPLIAILCMVLITAAVISTYFVWRSVVVPEEVSERIEARRAAEQTSQTGQTSRPANTTLATLLTEDGEIIPQREQPEQPEQPEPNHRRK